MRALSLVWALAGLAACGAEVRPAAAPSGAAASSKSADTGLDTGDPCASAGTWSTVAWPVALTACTGCHSSHHDGAARHGAPADVDLDTLSGWQTHGGRSLARMSEGTMPPGGGVPQADRGAVERWLACGAPGDAAWLDGAAAAWGPTDEAITLTTVEDDGGTATVTWAASNRQGPETFGAVLVETVVLDAGEAWLVGWRRTTPGGDLLAAATYDPPLPLQGAGGSWTASTTATLDDGEGAWDEPQVWTFSEGAAATVDGRAPDPAPRQLVAVEDGGAEEGWLLSDRFGVTGRWRLQPDGDGFVALQLLLQGTSTWSGFPLRGGDAWRSQLVEYGGWE